MGHRRLRGVETVIQWQQGVFAKGDAKRFPGRAQDCGANVLRPHRRLLHRGPVAPLHHRLRVHAVLAAELRDRSVRSLYCRSDGVHGRGAAV